MQAAPYASVRALVLICLSIAGWGFSFGVGTQTAPLWLADSGLGDTAIGVVMGSYYLGIALTAVLVPWLMRRGASACVAGGMVLSAATVALFPLGGCLAGWLAVRVLQGGAAALSLIPLETCVSHGSAPRQRSRNVSLFTASLTLGGALGIEAATHLYAPGSLLPFWVAAAAGLACVALSAWGVAGLGACADGPENHHPLDLRGNFLSYATAWSQGFLEAGMFAFLLLFLLARGVAAETAGDLMSATVVGVLLFQVPVGWLADRLGTTPVLLACYAVTALGLLVMPFCAPGLGLGVWLFLVGACSGAFYPLGLALLGERVPAGGLARAYSCYMAMECLGSMMGPVCMGPARTLAGDGAMFAAGESAVLLVLVMWAILRLLPSRLAVPYSDAGKRRAA